MKAVSVTGEKTQQPSQQNIGCEGHIHLCGRMGTVLLWEPRLMADTLIKAGKQKSRLERNNFFLIKLPLGYLVEDVQEADKGTDLDVMLRDRCWEQEMIKT